MCLSQGPQRSDAGEARTRGPILCVCLCVLMPLPRGAVGWSAISISVAFPC